MISRMHRRDWLRAAAAGGASLVVLRDSRSARGYFANEKLGAALVGLSGRGQWFVETVPRIGEDVVAACDVEPAGPPMRSRSSPACGSSEDFRKMLDGWSADRRGVRRYARQHPR